MVGTEAMIAQTVIAPMRPHAIVVFAHGSRDPLWKVPVERVAQIIAEREPAVLVDCAYLELTTPDLPTVITQIKSKLIANKGRGCWTIAVFPLFFGVGRHVREDLPALVDACRVDHPNLNIVLLNSAGENQVVLEAAADVALGKAVVRS